MMQTLMPSFMRWEVLSNYELVKGAEKFVCKLYGQNCGTVNEARYNLFLTTTKSETNLPPSADSLKKTCIESKLPGCCSLTMSGSIPTMS